MSNLLHGEKYVFLQGQINEYLLHRYLPTCQPACLFRQSYYDWNFWHLHMLNMFYFTLNGNYWTHFIRSYLQPEKSSGEPMRRNSSRSWGTAVWRTSAWVRTIQQRCLWTLWPQTAAQQFRIFVILERKTWRILAEKYVVPHAVVALAKR